MMHDAMRRAVFVVKSLSNLLIWRISVSTSTRIPRDAVRGRSEKTTAVKTAVARATTVVRYDSKRRFPEHTHTGGEEFLVLAGTFSDPLTGDCTQGYYVRNPIGSSHSPWTDEDGTTILVKLQQMVDATEPHVVKDTGAFYESADQTQDVVRMDLFFNENTNERVWMEWWKGGVEKAPFDHYEGAKEGGVEFFLVNGDLECGGAHYDSSTWLRFPSLARESSVKLATQSGCQLWVKTGHLP